MAVVQEAVLVQELTTSWEFKQTDLDNWMPVKSVPTNIHLDLIDNNAIPDPFLGFNELECQWVADKSWTYRVTLPRVTAAKNGQVHELVFQGLDTFATVKVNGKVILESDNMFIPHRIDVTNILDDRKENVLEIEFASALLQAHKIKDAHPEHKWVGFNGDVARLAVRKAQYHWGWDWGPLLMTGGPWQPVRLETSHVRISDVRVDYDLNDTLDKVTGKIAVKTHGTTSAAKLHVSINHDDHLVFENTVSSTANGVTVVDFELSQPELWFPHGYGDQPLYTCTATLTTDDRVLDTCSKRIGFRRGELIQNPDEVGKTFYFRINDVDVFCGGSCWIPADSFTPRITKEKYRSWLQTIIDGYQVMIRIWGGGIWEEDIFYDTCDELGILVWQDFMFGCGNYPAHKEFRDSVEAESVAQVQRIRHHPSIVIFAGNNEDYQVQEQFGLTYDYADKDPENWLKTDFPARYIYEKLLPEVVAAHSPHIPYHPGSPWGDGLISSNPTVGDMHQWNVWHGTQEKYQIFDTLGGRFNSEFGMEAFPHIDTIKYYVNDPTQLYAQSHMLDFHNKADGHERRIATYLVENFRTDYDNSLEGYIHLTQLSQSDALMYGYRGWRKQWGEKRLCGGALVWQLNDCWPVSSWAIIDYFQRKKPAYYAMRRVLAPIAVAVKRAHHDWSVVHARPAKTSTFECWVSSNKTVDVTATKVELRFISIATGKETKSSVIKKDVKITANGTTLIFDGVIDNEKEEPHVLAARIWVEGSEAVASRDTDWPQPLKYLNMEQRGVKVDSQDGRIVITADKPTKGLVFEEREGVLVDDSALDLVPGDEQVVTVKGLRLGDAPLGWRFYGQRLDQDR